jgi:hypothetical protein
MSYSTGGTARKRSVAPGYWPQRLRRDDSRRLAAFCGGTHF